MKFKIKIQYDDTGETRWEEYDEDIEDAQQWAKETLEFFNGSLRPRESPRTLLDVVVLEDGE